MLAQERFVHQTLVLVRERQVPDQYEGVVDTFV
jgi:hypothetical protein